MRNTYQVVVLRVFKLLVTCKNNVKFVSHETWHATLISNYYGFGILGLCRMILGCLRLKLYSLSSQFLLMMLLLLFMELMILKALGWMVSTLCFSRRLGALLGMTLWMLWMNSYLIISSLILLMLLLLLFSWKLLMLLMSKISALSPIVQLFTRLL